MDNNKFSLSSILYGNFWRCPEKILIYGPPGTGKTTLAIRISAVFSKNLLYVFEKETAFISTRMAELNSYIEKTNHLFKEEEFKKKLNYMAFDNWKTGWDANQITTDFLVLDLIGMRKRNYNYASRRCFVLESCKDGKGPLCPNEIVLESDLIIKCSFNGGKPLATVEKYRYDYAGKSFEIERF